MGPDSTSSEEQTMPTRGEAYQLVRDDVIFGIGNIFVPQGNPDPDDFELELLSLGGFDFSEKDIPEEAEVCAVAWQLRAVHQRPLVATSGNDANGETIPVLESNPADHLLATPLAAGIRESFRPVTIYGVTL